jgi:hypothetical protein
MGLTHLLDLSAALATLNRRTWCVLAKVQQRQHPGNCRPTRASSANGAKQIRETLSWQPRFDDLSGAPDQPIQRIQRIRN